MKRYSLVNRKKQNIIVVVDHTTNPKGLAIVMHGLSGNKEQPHIVAFAEAFKEKEFTVVRFDTTNTFGESDGRYEDSTVTTFYEDLEDVLVWVKKQDWYEEPFYLAGHSLGGMSIILYAQKHPAEIKGLAPISTVVSGKLNKETKFEQPNLAMWEKTGWKTEKSLTSPTGVKKLPWSHMLDRMQYDVLPDADKLSMPVLLIVGGHDDGTPYEHQKILFDKLTGTKEIHIIKDAPHTFRTPEHLTEVKNIFSKWIDKVESK